MFTNDTLDTKQKYFEYLQVGDFGMAPQVDEGTRIGYDDFDTPYSKQYTPVKRALGFYVTEEAIETDRYMVVRNGMNMAYAFDKTLEQVCANGINNATSTSTPYVGMDGVALASDSHPLATGMGVYDNNTTDVFGPITLETAIQTLLAQKSHRGDPSPDPGPYTLVTGTSLAGISNRVVKASGLAGTFDHDPNWGGDQISGICNNPYITSTTAWALVSKQWRSFLAVRRTLRTKSQFDIDYDATKYVATTMYLWHFADWRGFQYSAGA